MGASRPTLKLGGTRWALVELEGEEVAREEGKGEPYLELDLEASRLAGSGGVKPPLVGSFELEGDELRLGPVGPTMMAGPEPAMRLARAFVSALERVAAHELDGGVLSLLDDDGVVVARLAGDRPPFEPEPPSA